MVVLVLGIMTGVVLAPTGAGGAVFAAPMPVVGIHLSMAQAAPIALLAVEMAAATGAALGLRRRIVRYRGALLISACGMIFSPAGLWLARRVDNRLLTVLFALVLLVVAYRMFQQGNRSKGVDRVRSAASPPCRRHSGSGRFMWTRPCARVLALSGGIVGFLSGLLGIGGGFVMVPVSRRFTDLGMDSIVATSLAVIALVSLSAVATSALSATLNWTVALPFAGGAVVGMASGRVLSCTLSEPYLQRVFALAAVLVALGLMLRVVVP